MFRKNPFLSAVALAAVLAMVSGVLFIPPAAAAYSKNLLVNSEFRDGAASWALGEFGAVDGKVTREGYPSIKLAVAKAKAPVDAKIAQALPAGSWAEGDTLTFSAWLARGKTSAFTKKTLPALALYAAVNDETTLFPSAEIRKLNDIKEAGAKNKADAWSRFSVTMTVPRGAAEVGCLLTFPQNGVMHLAQPKVERGSTASDWFPDPGFKEIAQDGSVLVGTTGGEGFSLWLPAGACPGAGDISVITRSGDKLPAMPHAVPAGDAWVIGTGSPVRLEEAALFTFAYDPAETFNPLMLCLGCFDAGGWRYIPAENIDAESGTATFRLCHLGVYYPLTFTGFMAAAGHCDGQLAARVALGEGGGDAATASRTAAELIAGKLGLGQSASAMRLTADIAADPDVLRLAAACQQEGWRLAGFDKLMRSLCDRMAQRLAGTTARDGAALTEEEKALQEIGSLLKQTDSGGRILAGLAQGDSEAVAGELFGAATDSAGSAYMALLYTLQVMQNTLDVWRDGETEMAFEIYTGISSGSLFAYGPTRPLDFGAVWDGMKGAARQLCVRRIAAENKARGLVGLPALTAAEEGFYRVRVRDELKAEFERRVKLQDRISAEKENLALIFTQLERGGPPDSADAWISGLSRYTRKLDTSLSQLERLIGRIYGDLAVSTVYDGPQLNGDLNGRISAAAMAEMIRGYFTADTQADRESFLRQYCRKADLPLAQLTADDIAGTYAMTMDQQPMGMCRITSSGGTVSAELLDDIFSCTFADGLLEGLTRTEEHKEGKIRVFPREARLSAQFSVSGSMISGQTTIAYYVNNVYSYYINPALLKID